MKKMDKKKQKKRIRLIKSLVLVVAFIATISATFGITMAYFGGSANSGDGKITLKTGIWINASAPTIVSASQYVVPSQVVEPECQVSIKSSKEKTGDVSTDDMATKALLKATITITDGTGSNLGTSAAADYFVVKDGSDNTVGHFVKDATVSGSNVYYFMPTSVTTALNASAKESTTTLMQVVDTTSGEVTYKFNLKITIPSTLGNAAGGQEIKVSVAYQAIQADFYDTNGAMITKNVKNAESIFGVTNDDVNYAPAA